MKHFFSVVGMLLGALVARHFIDANNGLIWILGMIVGWFVGRAIARKGFNIPVQLGSMKYFYAAIGMLFGLFIVRLFMDPWDSGPIVIIEYSVGMVIGCFIGLKCAKKGFSVTASISEIKPVALSTQISVLGFVIVLVALLWFGYFFEGINAKGLSCIYASDTACEVMSVIQRFKGKTAYSPVLFWIGIILILGGAIAGSAASIKSNESKGLSTNPSNSPAQNQKYIAGSLPAENLVQRENFQAVRSSNTQPLVASVVVQTQTNEEKLKELKRLHDAGLISPDVYAAQQKIILGN